MAKVFLTDSADRDLLDIWLFIAKDSIRAADKWFHTLETKCKQLAENPLSGRLREKLAYNLRSFPVQDYILFYQPVEEGILLIRVLHGSRDIDYLLFDY